MRRRLPPLSTLRLFDSAARLLSFKKAAEELLLTPSAVSHGIQTLEEWLGVPLFARTPRGLRLSEAGRIYRPIVGEALGMIATGAARIGGRPDGSRLSISAAPTFAAKWLLPRLADFRARHPDIAVIIDTARDPVGIEDGEADLAIRMGRGGWAGLAADRLFAETLVPVCAPAIAARVRDLQDIEAAPLIHVTTVSEDWAAWAAAAGRRPPNPAKGLRFDTIQMAFDAAIQGLGVAIGRRPLVDTELDSGKLIAPWLPAAPSNTAYWLVGPSGRVDGGAIAAFRSWIVAAAAGATATPPSSPASPAG
jgi:DNA-binding transcriptional LysR family regulator